MKPVTAIAGPGPVNEPAVNETAIARLPAPFTVKSPDAAPLAGTTPAPSAEVTVFAKSSVTLVALVPSALILPKSIGVFSTIDSGATMVALALAVKSVANTLPETIRELASIEDITDGFVKHRGEQILQFLACPVWGVI